MPRKSNKTPRAQSDSSAEPTSSLQPAPIEKFRSKAFDFFVHTSLGLIPPLLIVIASDGPYDSPALLGAILLISAYCILHGMVRPHHRTARLWIVTRLKRLFAVVDRSRLVLLAQAAIRPSTFRVVFAFALAALGFATLISPAAIQSILIETVYGTHRIDSSNFDDHVVWLRKEVEQHLSHISVARSRGTDFTFGSSPAGIDRLFSTQKDRLVFLIGPAGAGKTPLAQQIAYQSIECDTFDKVFFVSLEAKDFSFSDVFSDSPAAASIPHLLAHRFGTDRGEGHMICPDPTYYTRLCQCQRVLVVLDGLDELAQLSPDSAPDTTRIAAMIRAAGAFCDTYHATVLITSRPEALYFVDGQNRGSMPSYDVLTVQPLAAEHFDAHLTRWASIPELHKARSNEAARLLRKRSLAALQDGDVLREMGSQIDYLHLIARSIDELEGRDAHEQMEFLISGRFTRNEGSHWDRFRINPDVVKTEVAKLCFLSLKEGKRTIEPPKGVDVLFCSGLCEVSHESGAQYRITPPIVGEYLAVKYCVDGGQKVASELKGDLSIPLSKAIQRFSTYGQPVIDAIDKDFEENPESYLDCLAALVLILGKERVRDVLNTAPIESNEIIHAVVQ